MSRVTASIVIDAPPKEVWQIVADPRNLPHWNRRITKVHGVPRSGIEEGSEYTTVVSFMGVGAHVDAEVLELEEPTFSKIKLSGPVLEAIVTTQLTEVDGGKTNLQFTAPAEKLLNLLPIDIGRLIHYIRPNVKIPNADALFAEVIDKVSTKELEIQDREGRWFSLRIRPYRTRDNKIEGAVIVLVDIDDLKRALEGVLSVVKQPLVTLSADLKVKKANDCFCKAFGVSAEAIENRPIYEIGDGQWRIPKLQTLLEAILPDNPHVDDYELDLKSNGEQKKIRLSARRFYEETRGMQMILLAMEVLPQ